VDGQDGIVHVGVCGHCCCVAVLLRRCAAVVAAAAVVVGTQGT